jgi:salicylate hydroxylase
MSGKRVLVSLSQGNTTHPRKNRIGEDRHVMTYCIAGGKTFNLVLSHVDHTDPSTWEPENAVRDMKEYFQGWDPK